jgi:2-iminobutanoate/2-iminopropanoate deaminase
MRPSSGQRAGEWATRGGNTLFTAHTAVRPDGTLESASPTAQVEATFANLERAVTAAGGSMDDVAQVTVFLTDMALAPVLDDVWRRRFRPPYPNRATIGIVCLTVPGPMIEIVAHAHIGR